MNNSSNGNGIALRLYHRGSHVPSFKNSKLLTRGKLVTSPRNQKWMKECIKSFESQLLCSFRTIESETVTAQNLRSWIASCVPENDSCRYLTACSWNFIEVSKGQEGANVDINPEEAPKM